MPYRVDYGFFQESFFFIGSFQFSELSLTRHTYLTNLHIAYKVHSLNSSTLFSLMHPSEHTFLKPFKKTRSHVLSGVELLASPQVFKPDNTVLLVFQTVLT